MKTLVLLLMTASPAAAAELPHFMTGTWSAAVDGVRMEEHWTTGDGNLMLGLHRDVRPNGRVFFEFLRVEVRDGVPAYIAQPGGRPATVFPMKSMTDSRVVFENLQHDFPQRIVYWRDGARLCARVEGPMEGKEVSQQWCWDRLTR